MPVVGAAALILAGSAASWGGTLTAADGMSATASVVAVSLVPSGADGWHAPLAASSSSLTGAGLSTLPSLSDDGMTVEIQRLVQHRAERRSAALTRVAERAKTRGEQIKAEREAARLAREAELAEARAELLEAQANQWTAPLSAYLLTARWGELSSYWSTYHTGLDFAAASGSAIVSVAPGTVTYVGYDGAYGNKSEITLEDGTVIWYAHQTSQVVSLGDEVLSGQLIGYVGTTGNVTGPHLHVEVRLPSVVGVDGQDVDPYEAFAEHGLLL